MKQLFPKSCAWLTRYLRPKFSIFLNTFISIIIGITHYFKMKIGFAKIQPICNLKIRKVNNTIQQTVSIFGVFKTAWQRTSIFRK